MSGRQWRAQDGFIREILWVVLILAILAVVVLDGVALFTATQGVKDDAAKAAALAQTEYVQTLDLAAAKLAAKEALIRGNEQLVAFSSTTNPDGSVVFTVTARANAETRVFKFLRYVGLKKWVNQMTHPTATASSQ